MENIDESNQLFLFQSTLNYKHPVNATGIIKQIKNLESDKNINFVKNVKDSNIKVYLVFVICKNMKKFKKQKIVMIDNVQTEDLGNVPVSNIPGIGSGRKKILNSLSIKTVKDLIDAIKSDQEIYKTYNKKLENYLAMIEERESWLFLENIEQYVIKLDGDYTDDDNEKNKDSD